MPCARCSRRCRWAAPRCGVAVPFTLPLREAQDEADGEGVKELDALGVSEPLAEPLARTERETDGVPLAEGGSVPL